jgi:hypothetical protein
MGMGNGKEIHINPLAFLIGNPIVQSTNAEALTRSLQALYETPIQDPLRTDIDFSPVVLSLGVLEEGDITAIQAVVNAQDSSVRLFALQNANLQSILLADGFTTIDAPTLDSPVPVTIRYGQ